MKKLMLGNAAVARGAYEAGVTVVASYPGTPSTEITENIVKYDEIYAEWSPNEKVAGEVAIGASIGGARAMSCMKHVGLNVMADPVFTASYTGVSGGLVLCVADDPGMHSSQNEQDSRHYAKAAKLLMLEPSDSSECKEFTKKAFKISEDFDTPVIIRLSTRVSHSQGLVDEKDRENYELKDYEKNSAKYVMMPGNAIKRHVVVEERTKKEIEFEVSCSKGTYIRILCEDIAKKMGTIGYMKELQRTQVGTFTIEQSIPVEDLTKEAIEEHIITIEDLFRKLENIELNERKLQLFLNGVKLSFDLKDGIYKIYSNQQFIGIGIVKDKLLKRDIVIE